MPIRKALLEDLPVLLQLGELMHAESPRYSRLTFSMERAGKTLRFLIENAEGVVFVAEEAGQIIGGIGGLASAHWSSEDVVADEVFFFLLPNRRGRFAASRLICALRAWADLRGAHWLSAGLSTGLPPERMAALYKRLGFTPVSLGLEVTYKKGVEPCFSTLN